MADSAYVGPNVAKAAAAHRLEVLVVATSAGAKGFQPLSARWRAEATFGFSSKFHRRLVRH